MTAHVGDRLVLDPGLPGDIARAGVITGVREKHGARPTRTTRVLSGDAAHVESAEPVPEPLKVNQ
jgi:hypothetical protein